MSFFGFKSSKNKQGQGGGLPSATRSLTSSDGSNINQTGSIASTRDAQTPSRAGAGSAMGGGSGSALARGATPDHMNIQQQQMRNTTSPPQRPPPADASLYPWSVRKILFPGPNQNPFPRYGAATNSVSSTKGEVYMMGGLINGAMVKGDLWTIEAGNETAPCAPVATMAEGPGPRVGHAALLVGNAFIVFGGDTKVDEMDVLDDTLYLLNTSTKHWSRALPAGKRPSGRYGHTLNILGSKIFIFGGQVEGYFFNDLVAFDLNALQNSNNRWEFLVRNTADYDGPPQGPVPPARTNHTVVTYNNKLYLFGGTDGINWYNDVWAYDPNVNAWQHQDCIGFIPTAREGHAAALVGDVMYVFGGRTEEGKDLGDLAAFKIPTKRWYTFQNMGPSPSPRSGHGMTAVGTQIYVVGGEPSSAPKDPNELSIAYVLETSKIRYPADASQSAKGGQQNGSRRPSVGDRSGTPSQERTGSSQGQYINGVGPKWQQRNVSQDSMTEGPTAGKSPPDVFSLGSHNTGPGIGAFANRANAARDAPGGPASGPPAGPPPGGPPPNAPFGQQPQRHVPQQPQQAQIQGREPPPVAPLGQPNGVGRPPYAGPQGRDSPRFGQRTDSPQANGINSAPRGVVDRAGAISPPGAFPVSPPRQPPETNNAFTPSGPVHQQPQQPPQIQPQPPQQAPIQNLGAIPGAGPGMSPSTGPGISPSAGPSISPSAGPRGHQSSKDSFDSTSRDTMNTTEDAFKTPMEHNDRSLSAMGSRPAADSGLGSSPALSHQHESLLKELESARTKNAWYASELSMARKAGYQASSPVSDERNPDAFEDDDKPLMEALLKMRNELASVQQALMKQQSIAAEQIAQIEHQRDSAVNEAVYHKARSAAGGRRDDSLDLTGPAAEREQDSARRLALALSSQAELQSRIHSLAAELEAEHKSRMFAQDAQERAHARAEELDAHKQESTLALEQLRSELHEAQRIAREEAANAMEHQSNSRGLQVDKNQLSGKMAIIEAQNENHNNVLKALHQAVSASTEKASLLENKLEHERRERASIEEKLASLRSEHESRVSELEMTSRKLQDAEELAGKHAAEARTHREAVLAGFGRTTDRGLDGADLADERVEALQGQLENAREMAQRNQDAADHASNRLRSAEERIAGLEAYQEQASREGLNLRKQLQVQSREAVALHSEKADLQQQISSHKMDSTALQVQHSALRELLAERGIDPNSSPARSRALAVDDSQLRELQAQNETLSRAHEELRQSFDQRQEEANRGWEEKLQALDNDYQAAVRYLKGTEKMLSKMKSELHRYKTANKDLEDQLAKNSSRESSAAVTPTPPPDWENERDKMKADLENMSMRVTHSQQQLEAHMGEVRAAHAEREMAQQSLATAQRQNESEVASLKELNELLERRAEEAERKVQTLLDSVGERVDNYRHSKQLNGLSADEPGYAKGHSRGFSASSLGAESNYSNPGEGTANINDRNSMALDSLASELETLRSHWETTNKNYRSSQQSVNVTTPITPGGHLTTEGESLANWRRKLDLRDRENSEGRESASPHRAL